MCNVLHVVYAHEFSLLGILENRWRQGWRVGGREIQRRVARFMNCPASGLQQMGSATAGGAPKKQHPLGGRLIACDRGANRA